MTFIDDQLAARLRQLHVPLPRLWRDGVSQDTMDMLLYWATKEENKGMSLTYGSSTQFGTRSPVAYRAGWGL